MSFRLVDANWSGEFSAALQADASSLHAICPFIKRAVAESLVPDRTPRPLRIITRFNLADAYAGVTDLSALRFLLDKGAQIRGVKNLHAKVYVFGATRAIVTSANLTNAALGTNHEFGFVAEEKNIVSQCQSYFDKLWARAGNNLSLEQLLKWEEFVGRQLVTGGTPSQASELGDFGADVGLSWAPTPRVGWAAEPGRSFIKFLGEGHNRASPSMPTLEEVKRAGCHWACAWPVGKRPRQVSDGDLIFLGRLVKNPNDIQIFGMAIGIKHIPTRDDATADEIVARQWKARWPHYVRLHHPKFVAGTISNGVPLSALMASLGSDSFVSTQRNYEKGDGNFDPRLAFRQQPAVELTTDARLWMLTRLEQTFAQHGTLADEALLGLDWPSDIPTITLTSTSS